MVESAVVSASSVACLSFFLLFLLALNFHNGFCFCLNFHFLFFLLVFLFLLFLFINTSLLGDSDICCCLVLNNFTLRLILVKLRPLLSSSRYFRDSPSLKLSDSRFHLRPVFDTKICISLLTESINTCSKSSFGSKHTTNLSLHLAAGLPHQLCVVDQTVLGCIMLGLQSLKQSLLRPQYLYCTGRVLSKVHEASSMSN